MKGCFGGCGYEIGRELEDNLLGLCGSARGVVSLGSSPRLLEVCVGYMWGRIKQGLQVKDYVYSTYIGRERIACRLFVQFYVLEGTPDSLQTYCNKYN